LYPDRIIQEIEMIQIHIHDFLFGIKTFELYSYNPFLRLLEQPFHHIIGIRRIKEFGQLLGNRTSSPRTLLK